MTLIINRLKKENLPHVLFLNLIPAYSHGLSLTISRDYLSDYLSTIFDYRVFNRDFGMGWDTSPPIGESDGGGLARKPRQNLEGSQISEECE